MRFVRKLISALSAICFAGGVISLAGLLVALIYEVVARYGFNAPTIWVYDMARFLTGTLILLACPWSQRQNANIRIDSLAMMMPGRLRSAAEAAFITFLLLPALSVIGIAALTRARTAIVTGELDEISAWGPVVWPFYCAVAVALVVLWLQCAIGAIDAWLASRRTTTETA